MNNQLVVTHVRIKDLHNGTIKYHDELPEDLMKRLRDLHPIVRTCFGAFSSLEVWVDGFKYDLNPDREVMVWEEMTKMYLNATKGQNLSKKQIAKIWMKILLDVAEKYPLVVGEIPSA